jgi:hypothetical protein
LPAIEAATIKPKIMPPIGEPLFRQTWRKSESHRTKGVAIMTESDLI